MTGGRKPKGGGLLAAMEAAAGAAEAVARKCLGRARKRGGYRGIARRAWAEAEAAGHPPEMVKEIVLDTVAVAYQLTAAGYAPALALARRTRRARGPRQASVALHPATLHEFLSQEIYQRDEYWASDDLLKHARSLKRAILDHPARRGSRRLSPVENTVLAVILDTLAYRLEVAAWSPPATPGGKPPKGDGP